MRTAYIRGDCLFQGEDSLWYLAVLKGAVCLSLPFACCHGLHVSGKVLWYLEDVQHCSAGIDTDIQSQK